MGGRKGGGEERDGGGGGGREGNRKRGRIQFWVGGTTSMSKSLKSALGMGISGSRSPCTTCVTEVLKGCHKDIWQGCYRYVTEVLRMGISVSGYIPLPIKLL
jgi:hypothetical protein